MPTPRGWALLGSGLALIALWYAFGDQELLLAGAFLTTAQLFAVAYVRSRPPLLSVGRRLGSTAVHDGDTVGVTLVVRNRGPTALRNVALSDEVEGLGRASFLVARLRGGEAVSAAYRVVCRRRGAYRVGPTAGAASDPLGLAELPAAPGPEDRLVVYPAVERLAGLPTSGGGDPAMSASRPERAGRGGEDFYTLREYQRGDDLRRVHWPYSAKTDTLMIRQLETPRRSRALVLLDARPQAYESPAAFEKAVSGAASVVTHLVSAGVDADLWAGGPSPVNASRYAATMERLALAALSPGLDIVAAATRIRREAGGGALVLVTGSADRDLLSVQRLLSSKFGATVTMGASSAASPAVGDFLRLGVAVVTVAPHEDWAPAWGSAMRSMWAGG